MLRSILSDPRLVAMLFRIDGDLAEQSRRGGCPFCQHRLDDARYRRKPRAPFEVAPEYGWRLSLCCSRRGCRRRTLPPSVLFLGRRVYLGVVVVLVSAMTGGSSRSRLGRLRKELGIDRHTLERWRVWWRGAFPVTKFWKEARARFMPPPAEALLPRSLVARFASRKLEGVVALLRWLSPLSVPNHAQ
jgi:hypothetical protein